MKSLLPIFTIFLFACESNRVDTALKESSERINANTDIEQIRRKYPVGDVDNDKIQDTATVIFDRDNSIDEIICDQKNCSIKITFGRNIPEFSIDQSRELSFRRPRIWMEIRPTNYLYFQEPIGVGGMIFQYGLLKIRNGLKSQILRPLFLKTKILKTGSFRKMETTI